MRREKGVKILKEEQMISEQRKALSGNKSQSGKKRKKQSKVRMVRTEARRGKQIKRAENSPVCMRLLRGSQIREKSDLVVICQPHRFCWRQISLGN